MRRKISSTTVSGRTDQGAGAVVVSVADTGRTARASLDRITRAKEHWRVYIQGITELELLLNKQTILLSAWRAEDRARRSSRGRPAVCVDCSARDLEHFYTARVGGSTLCAGCFQGRVGRGAAREADIHHRWHAPTDGLAFSAIAEPQATEV